MSSSPRDRSSRPKRSPMTKRNPKLISSEPTGTTLGKLIVSNPHFSYRSLSVILAPFLCFCHVLILFVPSSWNQAFLLTQAHSQSLTRVQYLGVSLLKHQRPGLIYNIQLTIMKIEMMSAPSFDAIFFFFSTPLLFPCPLTSFFVRPLASLQPAAHKFFFSFLFEVCSFFTMTRLIFPYLSLMQRHRSSPRTSGESSNSCCSFCFSKFSPRLFSLPPRQALFFFAGISIYSFSVGRRVCMCVCLQFYMCALGSRPPMHVYMLNYMKIHACL